MAQDHIQLGFEYLQGWTLFLGNPHNKTKIKNKNTKKIIRYIYMEFYVFPLVLIVSCSDTKHH